jgi:uroporphyrin-III C-methyltransferase/precorrin-2 dehydrogenase/sirohydrochlorin ferrochelatase/uroporphyrin-III C-methyltransferase
MQQNGKVILIGAGPGDPELLTLKAARWLQQADVVLTDRLVSKEILETHVGVNAEVIYVGKQCRKKMSTPQQTINELLVEYAQQNKLVVRLKGGDVSIFSNILDELQTLAENGIPFEIVPGVTAALGAAAYSGIPLTARNHATAVRFLTYYKSDIVAENKWLELAQTDDTLVFYMSAETVSTVVEKLVANGISKEKKLAVIEQATTPFQQVHIYDLYEDLKKLHGTQFASPSLVIIGNVVALHEQFAWLPNSTVPDEYFAWEVEKVKERA